MAADTASLVYALQHTLSPDKETRVQAEAALAQVSSERTRIIPVLIEGRPSCCHLSLTPDPLVARSRPRRASWQSSCRLQRQAVRRYGSSSSWQCLCCVPSRSGCASADHVVRVGRAAVDPGVRQASSIYFKNVVRTEWNVGAGTSKFSEGVCRAATARQSAAPRALY